MSNEKICDISSGLSSTDEFMRKMDEVYDDTATIRKKLQDKLSVAVDEMKLDPNGDAEQLEAQIRLLNQMNVTLESREKASSKRVELRLKNKEAEDNAKFYAVIANDIIKSLDNKTVPFVHTADAPLTADAAVRVEQQLAELEKVEYNDGEVRKNPNDLT